MIDLGNMKYPVGEYWDDKEKYRRNTWLKEVTKIVRESLKTGSELSPELIAGVKQSYCFKELPNDVISAILKADHAQKTALVVAEEADKDMNNPPDNIASLEDYAERVRKWVTDVRSKKCRPVIGIPNQYNLIHCNNPDKFELVEDVQSPEQFMAIQCYNISERFMHELEMNVVAGGEIYREEDANRTRIKNIKDLMGVAIQLQERSGQKCVYKPHRKLSRKEAVDGSIKQLMAGESDRDALASMLLRQFYFDIGKYWLKTDDWNNERLLESLKDPCIRKMCYKDPTKDL